MAEIVQAQDDGVQAQSNASVHGATAEIKNTGKRSMLRPGESLKAGEALWSPNGQFRLIFQDDSNLCLYPEGKDAKWSSNTYHSDASEALLQQNGEFVLLRRGTIRPIWTTSTQVVAVDKASKTYLELRDDGSAAIMSDGNPIWTTNSASSERPPEKLVSKPQTKLRDRLRAHESLKQGENLVSLNGRYRVTVEYDGNLVLYASTGMLWSSNTWYGRSAEAIMMANGNLVLQPESADAGKRKNSRRDRRFEDEDSQWRNEAFENDESRWRNLWSVGAGDRGSLYPAFVVQNDGNVVILSNEEVIWSADTAAVARARAAKPAAEKIVRKPRTNLGDRLAVDQTLWRGENLVSKSGMFRLVFQDDGNLVLCTNQRVLWESKTTGRALEGAVIQADGDLVLQPTRELDPDFRRYSTWYSGSGGLGNSTSVLVVGDDGDMAIVSSGKVIWRTNTRQRNHVARTQLDRIEVGQVLEREEPLISANGRYKFVLQSDGNLVVYDGEKSIWNFGRQMDPTTQSSRIEVQADGNMNVYKYDDNVWWSVSAKGNEDKATILIMQDDGDLCLKSANKTLWSSTVRDRLNVGEGLKAGEGLVAGKYNLTFSASGVLCCTDTAGKSMYYYPDTSLSGIRALHFNKSGFLEYQGRREFPGQVVYQPSDDILGTITPRKGDLPTVDSRVDRTTHFRLHEDGWCRIMINGTERWSFRDLASGPTPSPPKFNNTLPADGKMVFKFGDLVSSNGMYRFRVTESRTAAVLGPDNKSIWTVPQTGDIFWLNNDGNLYFVNSQTQANWSSTTRKTRGSPRLVMQNDGNLVLWDDAKALWSSNSSIFMTVSQRRDY